MTLRTMLVTLVGTLAGAGAMLSAQPADTPYDLVIRGGKIVDGSGNPWYHGDLAVRGQRIVALGQVPPARPSAASTPRG